MKSFHRVTRLGLIGILAFLLSATIWADTIVLKNGQVLQGTFKGGTDSVILFQVDSEVKQVAVADVTSLTISPRSAPQVSTPPQQAAAVAQGPVTVPAGTKLMVKLGKTVSTQTDKVGSTFSGLLDTDLTVNGVIVAPKGSKLYGKVTTSEGGNRVGAQKIAIQYTDLVVGSQQYPIMTDQISAEGNQGGGLRKVAAGTLIGSAVDGRDGRKTGALIGAGVSVIGGGKHIQIAAGTLAEVYLKQPLTISR